MSQPLKLSQFMHSFIHPLYVLHRQDYRLTIYDYLHHMYQLKAHERQTVQLNHQCFNVIGKG